MALQEMPLGPLLLRDWGISEGDGLPIEHVRYKTQRIIELLAAYPSLSFLLLGDNGQRDPEVYLQTAQQYPGRVAAVLIRTVDFGEERREAVASIAAEFAALGTPYANGETSLELAAAAAEMGLMATSDLPRISAAKA
jgi:phosphatidate phosphatase APP1